MRVDEEAHELLKEHADRSGRTLRDLASEAIKNQTGRDLRNEVAEELDRLSTLSEQLEDQVSKLDELAAVPTELSELGERLEQVEEGLDAKNRTYAQHNAKLSKLVSAMEDAFGRAIEMLRGES